MILDADDWTLTINTNFNMLGYCMNTNKVNIISTSGAWIVPACRPKGGALHFSPLETPLRCAPLATLRDIS